MQQELPGAGRAHAVMAKDEQRLRGICQLFRRDGRPLGKREQFCAGDLGKLEFVRLAHIDEAGRIRGGEPLLRFADGDLRERHGRQCVTETGVPFSTWAKNRSAMKPGMRMQPCEAA